MLPVGFEPIVSAGERPKKYALDRAATGTGHAHRHKNVNSINSWVILCRFPTVCFVVYHTGMISECEL
jgi:hypothetical protein